MCRSDNSRVGYRLPFCWFGYRWHYMCTHWTAHRTVPPQSLRCTHTILAVDLTIAKCYRTERVTVGGREVPPTVSSLKGKKQISILNVHKYLHVANCVICTSKHRRCDTAKAKLVRSTPKTFKGLGLSQQTAFWGQKALLAGIIHIIRILD